MGFFYALNPHFSPTSYCDGAMPHPDWILLGHSAQHSVDYACALFGRKIQPWHDLSPSRYGGW